MNKLTLYILTVVVSLFYCIPSSAITKYTTANLNLRSGEGTDTEVITIIPRNCPIEIDEDCDCKWLPVSYNGHVGYIYARYISINPVRLNHTTHSYSSHKKSTNRHRSSRRRYYTNTYGNRVQSPTHYKRRPNGATALCNDGTYSFSQSSRGTCSHHGGVSEWY